ncbi:MAG: hypothetical protein ACYTG7_21575 [Planctomycetota bacterium]|jgi:flagellar hook assembly protein FlgD
MRWIVWILLFYLISSGMIFAVGEVSLTCDTDKIDSRNKRIAFTISDYDVEGPVKLQIYSYAKDKEETLVTSVLCRPAGPSKWKGVWYGKDDLGNDVKNGTYKVILKEKISQKIHSNLVEVVKFQVISDLTVQPNPYWPAPKEDTGGDRSASKAKISFFLEEACKVTVGIFPPGTGVDFDEWTGVIWMKEHATIDAGHVNFYWEGEVLDENDVSIVPDQYTLGDYTATVKAVDLEDTSNEAKAEYVFKVTPIPEIENPLCTPTSFSPNGDNINDYTEITFKVNSPYGEEKTGNLIVAVSIHDATGKRIVYITGKSVLSGENLVLFWNGTAGPTSLQLLRPGEEKQPIEQPQEPLPNGLYSVHIRAADSETNTLAPPKQTKVEIMNPISLMIDQFIADVEYVKSLKDKVQIDADFWQAPDTIWENDLSKNIKSGYAPTDQAAPDGGPPLTSKSKILPLPLLLPDQTYLPWIRYRVNKDANITLEIYSEDGGKEEVLKLGTARADELKTINFVDTFDSLRDGATYRAILIAVEIDDPIKVSDEFWFQVYRAEKPTVVAIDDWKILKTPSGPAVLNGMEIGNTVEFKVKMIYPATVNVDIYRSFDDKNNGYSPIRSLVSRDDLELLEKRIYWDGKDSMNEYVDEGVYFYEVIASRADKKMDELRNSMPALEFKTFVAGHHLWVITLPTPEIDYDPPETGEEQPACLISPDGRSTDQTLKMTFLSDNRAYDIQGTVNTQESADDPKIRVLDLISVDEEATGQCEWIAADQDDIPVQDGSYMIRWVATCSRNRINPVTRQEESVTFNLIVDPVNVIVDRKPYPSDITVEPLTVTPDKDGVDDRAMIRFKIGDDADVTLNIVGDRDSARLLTNFRMKKGFNFVEWKGRNIGGHYFKRWKDDQVTLSMLFEDDQGNVRTGNVNFNVHSYFSEMAKELSGIDDLSLFFNEYAEKHGSSPDPTFNSTDALRSNMSIIKTLFDISSESWELKKRMTGHYMTPEELEEMMEESEIEEDT